MRIDEDEVDHGAAHGRGYVTSLLEALATTLRFAVGYGPVRLRQGRAAWMQCAPAR